MQTNIPDNILPTEIAEPNSLTTTYTTNVLYPKLGPLAVNRHVRLMAGLLRDYAAATALIAKVKDYKKLFSTPVMVIRQPDAWLTEEITFKPLLANQDSYINSFVADLSSFRQPKIALEEISNFSGKTKLQVDAPVVTSGGSFNAPTTNRPAPVLMRPPSRGIPSERLTRNPVLVINESAADNKISAVSDIQLGELALINGRLAAPPLTPRQLLEAQNPISDTVNDAGIVKASPKNVQKTAEQQKRAYLLGNIMHGLSQVNSVVPDLIDLKVLNTEGALLKNAILDDSKYLTTVSKTLEGAYKVDDARINEVGLLVDQAFNYLSDLGLKNDNFIRNYKKDNALKKRVKRYVIGKIDKIKPIDYKPIPKQDEDQIVKTREWAFQRTERLDLTLGKPVLRGPFNAESVSPNSELNIAESFTSEQFNLSESLVGQAEQRSSEQGTFTSSRFQSALSNMTESGVTSENSFTQDSTLLNTLKDQRRQTIDRTLTSISRENEQRDVSASRIITSTSRSYTTRGKDPVFATTELAFQVSAPVQAQVRLEDVNLVWAPSIPSPFLRLHNIIREHQANSEFEYIEQNLIVDPVRPFEEYESQTISKEISIRGRDNYQSKTFDIPIDAKFSGDGWELDKAASTINYRNGTGDDYNWDEQWNWDDLENWSTSFKSIYQEGEQIKGEAVLETTDPEYFNRGFFSFGFVMRRLSERSRAELRVYAADQAATEADRRAVYSRARQYAKLRRDELISHYQNSLDLQEEAFTSLIAQVFQGISPQYYGYYKEIIRSSINWTNTTMHFEANLAPGLPFPEYGRSHFMNASAIRFILPILREGEDAFFEAIGKNGSNYYKTSANKVRGYTDKYRKRVEELKTNDPAKLILDEYTREVVIGRHLEAVLSKHPFAQ